MAKSKSNLYEQMKTEATKAFNFPSKKMCSDSDICTHLKTIQSRNLNLSDAMKTITTELKKDTELRKSWSANIAMAFIDNEHWYKQKTEKKTLNSQDKHTIANNAAEYFLELLCK